MKAKAALTGAFMRGAGFRGRPYVPPPGLVDALARYLLDGTRPSDAPPGAPSWSRQRRNTLAQWRETWRKAGMPPLE